MAEVYSGKQSFNSHDHWLFIGTSSIGSIIHRCAALRSSFDLRCFYWVVSKLRVELKGLNGLKIVKSN